ncbi:hypothetical protein EYZ11_008101 [Aspergillus tanneri]|uniref:Uncharacterized protein n=1 Tax=Aspergillus tanneri TaxID=1220188 RepID=A0A4S3JBR1_9EURO|nr:uncharacterized protein ATNIH1004_004335 [Aspergillus tanneri]KAA8648450.1 hypothetical protein ATNIH1004_004335 [Aspergillus tanneri]THC92435.1 hypothetical protein EYZ11_008101 [Aspergillus tanneri]
MPIQRELEIHQSPSICTGDWTLRADDRPLQDGPGIGHTRQSSPHPGHEEAMDTEDQQLPSSPGLTGGVTLEDDLDSTASGMPSFMAVSQYPNAASSEPNFLSVSEVVNAVIEREDIFHPHARNEAAPGLSSSSPPTELYISDSEMTDVVSDFGGVPLGSYGTHTAIGDLVHHLIDNATVGQTISTIPEGSEDERVDLFVDYEPPLPEQQPNISQARDDDLDDTQRPYSDDDNSGEYGEEYVNYSPTGHTHEHIPDIDFDDFYRGLDRDYDSQPTDDSTGSGHVDHSSLSDEEDAAGDPHLAASAVQGTIHERNFNIDQFISQWVHSSIASIPSFPLVSAPLPPCPLANILGWTPAQKIIRPSSYSGDFFDLQQIPWWEALRVKRSDARRLRDFWYTSYHNLESSNQPGIKLPQEEFYFREKSMYTRCKATIEHFQLRNLMSVAAYNTVHFARESKMYSWIPPYDDLRCLIDLAKPAVELGFQGPVKISSMKSAQDVVIAGGFLGEYALRAAGAEGSGAEGFVTRDLNGITNHIDVVPSRTNRTPMGIFASNDRHLRVLDCETNTFVADHELSRAINCTATSPDGRLRVVIGDSPDAWIIEADSGRPVHPLRGHRDFGFACAWSPDMRHIATSNQDKTAIIWDARTWKALEKIESDVAGYRSLHYSPVGGGPRTLLLCEPADRISIVNAQTYQTRQVHDFFGEIGGADYSADGSTIWVANADEHFGGFMQFERRQWGQPYGIRELPNEWVRESELDEDDRCALSERERQLRFWWNLSDYEHEALLL